MEPVVWLAAFVVLIVVEAITLGLTTIWMAFAALIAAAAAALGAPMWAQFVLFVVMSVVLFLFTRPIAMKYFNKNREKTNVESMIGRRAIVTEDIDNLHGSGQAAVDGMQWSARTASDEAKIAAGTEVEVLEVRGVRLIVRAVSEKAETEK